MALVNPNNQNNNEFNPNVDNSEIAVRANSGGKIITYISFIFIIPIFMYIGARNKLVRLQMNINNASSGIDVQLKKRKDTLVKLVDAAKSSIQFEKELVSDVTKLRSGSGGSLASEDAELSKIQARVFATFEAYPNIKSTDTIVKLMAVSEDIEREIAASRRLYNSFVNEFNSAIFVWPGSVVASGMHLSKLPLFAASNEDKKDVSLKLM